MAANGATPGPGADPRTRAAFRAEILRNLMSAAADVPTRAPNIVTLPQQVKLPDEFVPEAGPTGSRKPMLSGYPIEGWGGARWLENGQRSWSYWYSPSAAEKRCGSQPQPKLRKSPTFWRNLNLGSNGQPTPGFRRRRSTPDARSWCWTSKIESSS